MGGRLGRLPPHLLTGQMTTAAADLLPEVSWSPDDRRLVFSSDRGELYVVNADGTDLHRIGERTHQRGHPVWSPDGSLIAYTGQPLADPYQQTSSWVITPDGLTDKEVIPAEGGWEMTNVDPSWSIDGRSFLVHTGGATEIGYSATSISIARRDVAGSWSVSRIVSASTGTISPRGRPPAPGSPSFDTSTGPIRRSLS